MGSTRRPDRTPGESNRLSETGSSDERVNEVSAEGKGKPSVPNAVPPSVEIERTVASSRPPVGQEAFKLASTPLEMGRSLVHRHLGYFYLEEFIGGGGMGAVFKAQDEMLNRTVAVKVLSQIQSTDVEALRRFKNEAQSAARLDNENIARVFYVGEDDGWNYIVFEYIEGINIRDLVHERGPLDFDESLSYAWQVAEALHHAHQRNVVHRDIKPSNVLITPDGKAKLVDMGLARLHQVESSQADITVSGVTLGTFDYISPEQARDPRSADVRSDIYSLGCTVFFMLAGRPPFPEGTMLQKLLSHTSDAPPDLRQFRADVPEEVTAMLSKMLEKTPALRHQTPAELITDLVHISDYLGLKITRGRTTVLVPPERTRFQWLTNFLPWLAPVLILIILAVFLRFLSPAAPLVVPKPKIPELPQAPATEVVENLSENRVALGGDDAKSSDVDAAPAKVADATRHDDSLSTSPGSQNASAVTIDDKLSEDEGDDNGDTTQRPLRTSPSLTEGHDTKEGTSSADFETGIESREVVKKIDAIGNTGEFQRVALADNQIRTIVVGSADDEPSRPAFRSLKSAIEYVNQHAKDLLHLEAIELQFDDLLYEASLELNNLSLTIRGAPGFNPIVCFRPIVDDQVQHPRSMVRVTGGKVNFENMHFVMDLPRDPVERWSLFELDGVDSFNLIDSSMTIRPDPAHGASPDHVAFLDVRSVPRVVDTDPAVGVELPQMPIALDNCLARGEAVLLRAEEVRPLRLTWNNGLLISTECLMSADGTRLESRSGANIVLDLHHVTAVVDQGLCKLGSSQLAPFLLTPDIQIEHCIIITHPDAPLFDLKGVLDPETSLEQFVFTGDRNFYEGVDSASDKIYWRMSLDDGTVSQLNFTEWKRYWGKQDLVSKEGMVKWKQLPDPKVPVSQRSSDDYRLGASPNPALKSGPAFDNSDAGVQMELLPQFPVLPEWSVDDSR